ncbi:hypothetical protein [Peredibacter starrii]|uniref:Uncharacterized protein n=1 Tax=Peredibacter starrii TaxID=28202 RepID=A0AAX4HQ18_9BACT|nr:hypothetical protein [Peredibacter starrii]WPU65049.1 hypothetical protein SOO65_20340 [Peredibacter starrii]
MNKFLILMLMTSLLSVSCNKSGDGGSSSDETQTAPVTGDDSTGTDTSGGDDTTSTPAPTPTPNVPAQALTFSTNVELLNFNTDQAAKYNEAIELVKLVVGTEEFRNKVLNHTYNGIKQFADNGGKTNAQIYQSILDAAEKLYPAKNNRMDLEVELYYANNTVVGYTNGSTTQIWVNTKFFNNYKVNSVAGNLFHEWLHKLGYGHDSAATAKRPYSVPYAIGYIMADIAQDFM